MMDDATAFRQNGRERHIVHQKHRHSPAAIQLVCCDSFEIACAQKNKDKNVICASYLPKPT
jgi:hypothetical protein